MEIKINVTEEQLRDLIWAVKKESHRWGQIWVDDYQKGNMVDVEIGQRIQAEYEDLVNILMKAGALE